MHGRAQGGKDSVALKQEWIDALNDGLAATGLGLPGNVQIDFPFYGDILDAEVERMAMPHVSGAGAMGTGETDEYSRFLAAALTEIQAVEQLDEDAIRAEMPAGAVGEMGPANWE